MNRSPLSASRLRLPLLLLLAALVLSGSGCATMVQNPEVRLLDLSVSSLGLGGGTARVLLEVDNPNRMAIEVRGLEYLIEVAPPGGGSTSWDTLATGSHADTLRIEGRSVQSVTLDVPFRYSAVGTAFRSWLDGGDIPYRIEGDVTARALMSQRSYPFRNTGTFRP